MLVGYARTSTLDQTAGLEAQQEELNKAGCEKVFIEQVSSVDVARREQLIEALDYIREGDTLIVTKLDRLARSVSHLLELLEQIESKKASLRILSMGVDTGTATGKLMLTILGSVAEFERSIMLERQREGIAKAKAAGKYKGRKPTARAKIDEIKALKSEGLPVIDIARKLNIGRASVYRLLKE
ncbi:recombinase family protein [Aliishimia ponticola]|uniref:Recombinase family protein n=1 Tax=Aliishimia ponticola TaxID=2499833 RepID=A0A4S4NCY2_9RHOB|nr:recombinase family protein [Aliishimia ponticola]THH37312.1 recombinase family protein [Aliishimia ponticola]